MSTGNEKTRITWIDGLKGLACIGVFTHHFFLHFFSASFYGDEYPSLLPGKFDELLSYKPYGVFINGNFWVCMFMVLACFLPALQIIKASDENVGNKLGSMVLKRYPRLMLPTFAVVFLNYTIVKFLNIIGLTERLPAYNFRQLIIDGLFKTWIQMDITLIGPFWTLHYLLFVPLFAAMLATTARKNNRYMPIVYVLMFGFFIDTNSTYDYYMAGIIGVLLADMIYRKRIPVIKNKLLGVLIIAVLVIVGLWLGGYPTYVAPSGSYLWLSFVSTSNNGGYVLLHLIGVWAILVGFFIWNEIDLPDILSTKVFKWLGKNCYGIFLVHLFALEYLGNVLMNGFQGLTGNIISAAILVYLALLVVVLIAAELFNRTVERATGIICSKIKI